MSRIITWETTGTVEEIGDVDGVPTITLKTKGGRTIALPACRDACRGAGKLLLYESVAIEFTLTGTLADRA